MGLIRILVRFIPGIWRNRTELVVENLAVRERVENMGIDESVIAMPQVGGLHRRYARAA